MTKDEAIAAVVGKRIVSVRFRDCDAMGHLSTDDNWSLDAFVLDDGIVLKFQGSGQIDYDDVWFEVALPEPPEEPAAT